MNPKLLIKYWRKKKGFSQNTLSSMVGISKSYLSLIERGLRLPKLEIIYNIASALEICPLLLLSCELDWNFSAGTVTSKQTNFRGCFNLCNYTLRRCTNENCCYILP